MWIDLEKFEKNIKNWTSVILQMQTKIKIKQSGFQKLDTMQQFVIK